MPTATIIVSSFDSLDGVIGRTITPGPGVSNATTFERFAYDGLSRLVRAENDHSVLTRTYDSLSDVASETVNGLTMSFGYDGESNSLVDIYPGGRTIATAVMS